MTENNEQDQTIEEKGLRVMNGILDRPSKETVKLIKDALINGEGDPVYTGIAIKKLAKIAEILSKDSQYKEIVESETKKLQEGSAKTFNAFGAKITIANTGYWDYSQTEDEYLGRLEDIETVVKELIKNRKASIELQKAEWDSKNSPLNIQQFGLKPFTLTWNELPELIWNEGYGEVNTNPPIKKGRESLRYTL